MKVNHIEGSGGIESLRERGRITGMRVRYALNKRLLRDPQSRRLFSQYKPSLCAPQSRILGELRTQGISITSLDELFGESAPGRWKAILALSSRFLDGELDGEADDGPQSSVHIGDPLFGLGISPIVLDAVNSFFELWSKLNQFGIGSSFPTPGSFTPRIRNQLWHRDQWDQVKVFLYLTDVDEGNGALEYIPESRRGGRHESLCPLPSGDGPEGYLRAAEKVVGDRVAAADRIVCMAPRIAGVLRHGRAAPRGIRTHSHQDHHDLGLLSTLCHGRSRLPVYRPGRIGA